MERPLRVAVTLEQCWHAVPGGTATSILRLLHALGDYDDIDMVGVAARHGLQPDEPFVPPVPVRHLGLPRPLLYEAWHAVGRPRVEAVTGAVDLVHATAVAVPGTSAPLVVTIHDLAFLEDPAHFTRHGLRFFRRGTELARRRAVRVMVPSESTAAECRAAGFDPEHLRVIPWGVRQPRIPDEAVVAEALDRLGVRRPFVLFVGTVEPRKNLSGLLAAAAALEGRDLDLVIVGPDGWNEDLGPKVRALDASTVRVRRTGFVAESDLSVLYSRCAVFCYPSFREGFGLPVLEAMSHGAPVVTSRGSATGEVLGDAGLAVDPSDPGALAEALVRVLDDPGLADEFRARGRERSMTFSWQRSAALTRDVYREVAA